MKSPQVFGKYLLLERISVGGMAEIFIAKAFGVEGFERILAIKKILPTMAEDLEFITMFIDEARISSQLNHANVVHIHELGKYDDAYYIAMEHVQGLDLRAIAELYRRERQAMPVPMAAYIVSKICEGLDYAHRAKDGRGQELNIVHRDVSPQNVLISFEGEVKIIDFGIAKATNRSQQTQVGILKGKFGYMSPEQALGKPIDRRSDLFAVGVILYELLTGDRLFVGESDFSVVEKVRNADVVSPREMNPEIPKGLEKVILKALARDQHERYQWCSELQEDLGRFLITDGSMYSTKHLSAFMKEAFADDLQREAEAMERYAQVKRPDDLEDSNVAVSPRKKISRQIPAVGTAGPRLTPAKGIPSGGAVPGRRPSDPALPKVGREPQRPEIGRKPTPAPRRAPTPETQPPPTVDRTQIVDASHLRDTPVEEQDTNVKTQHPPKGKVVIGDKAVHGPTVIGSVPESRSKPSLRRNAPPIDAPPSVVVDAGLGMEAGEGLPEDTGAFDRPPGFEDEEPRTQGVESYAFGEELPEHTPVAAAPEEDDEAPPPWPSLEGRGETVVGPAPTAPPKRISSLAQESNRRRAEAAEAEAAQSASVIVGGGRLEDSDEATPTPADPVGEQTAPLETAAVEAAATSRASGFEEAPPTSEMESLAAGPAREVPPALGDAEAPPSTGSATQLAHPAPSTAADELDALMGAEPSAAPFQLRDSEPPSQEERGEAEGTGPMEFGSDKAPAAAVPWQEPAAEEEEEDDSERTAAFEAPSLAAPPPSERADAVREEAESGYGGEDRTAATLAPSVAGAGDEEDEPGYGGHDRTAATPAPSELMDAAGDEEGYGGHDRTAAVPAPSALDEEEDAQHELATDSGVGRAAHEEEEEEREEERPEGDEEERPYGDEDGEPRGGETGITEAPENEEPFGEEEEAEDEATRPQRSPRRAPARASPLAMLTGRNRMIVLGGAGAGLVLVIVLMALLLGGKDPAGVLMVITQPATAQITLDGQEVKANEVLTGLEAGPHELVVTAPGFVTHRATLQVTDTQTTTQVKLVKQAPPEPVAAAGSPPAITGGEPAQAAAQPPETGAAASPDREEAPQAAAEARPDPATGSAEPTEPAPREEPVKEPAPAPEGETRVVSATRPVVREERKPEIRQTRTPPKRRTGKLAITSSPMGAEIFLNGKSTGRKTPVAFGSALTVPAGTNMLVLKSGSLKFMQEIEIDADEMNIVRNAVLK